MYLGNLLNPFNDNRYNKKTYALITQTIAISKKKIFNKIKIGYYISSNDTVVKTTVIRQNPTRSLGTHTTPHHLHKYLANNSKTSILQSYKPIKHFVFVTNNISKNT